MNARKPTHRTDQTHSHGIPRREHVALSGVFAMQYAAVGLTMMLPLILARRGLQAAEIGFLSAIYAGAGAVTQVAMGRLSDALQLRRPFILLPSLLIGVAYALLADDRQYAAYAAIYFVAGACFHTSVTAVTAMVADWSSMGHTASAFAATRLWGSVGFVASLAALSPWLDSDRLVISGTVIFFALAAAATVPAREPARHVHVAADISASARRLFRDPQMALFLGVYLLFKMSESASMAFFALLLDSLGGSRQVVAWALVLNAVCEIPLMRWAGPLSERIGRRPVIMVALLVLPARLLAYSQIPSAAWVWPVQAFHGFTYAFMLVAAVAYTNDRAPQNLRATAQGMLGMANALGMAAGPFAGALLSDAFGLRGLYAALAGISLCAAVVFLLFGAESRKAFHGNTGNFIARLASRPVVTFPDHRAHYDEERPATDDR